MWGPCACPGRTTILLGAVQIPRGDGDPDEDKHKAPTLPLIHPLSLRDAGALLLPIRFSKFIRG
jgi:hypothetical protein